jgi:hypothetical protein
MKKNNVLPYRFFPASDMHQTNIFDDYIQMTFSDFLKETIQMHVLTGTKVSCLDTISCVNDTGVLACGQKCERVQCMYLHTLYKGNQLNEAAVIIAINDLTTKNLRFFKGLWDLVQNDIMVWCELLPDIARQEITYLENITA